MNGYDLIEFVGRRAWLFWLLPPVIWLLIRGRVKHIERCRADVQYARASAALRRFKRLVAADEEAALRGYIADRFGLCAAALSRESCADELESHGFSSDVVQMARDYFALSDARRYSLVRGAQESRVAVKKLVNAIQRGGRILLLLLMALMPLMILAGGGSADKGATAAGACRGGSLNCNDFEAAAQKFSLAMNLKAERPDEAQPLFVEAALAFESAREHFNAGNSWFFAGESGRALAAYLAAESRAPFSSDIIDTLKFIRSQHQEEFPAQSGVISASFAWWRQICRWEPHLRLGLLTLVYLGVWLVYSLSRIFGWQPGRRFWVSCGAVMLLIGLTLLYSLIQPGRGVLIQSAEARLGPGYAYAPAFESVLRPAVEFEWQRREGNWILIRLPDKTSVWVHQSACVRVR